MPQKESAFRGKYVEIVHQLEDLGFSNVIAEGTYSVGFGQSEGDVVNITIGGVTNFKAKDRFNKSDPVRVYYRTKDKK